MQTSSPQLVGILIINWDAQTVVEALAVDGGRWEVLKFRLRPIDLLLCREGRPFGRLEVGRS